MSVTATDVASGTIIIEGLISSSTNSIVLELQTTSNAMQKSEPLQHVFEIGDLQWVEFIQNVVRSRINLEAQKLSTFADVPGARQNQLRLNVARKYRDRAADLATHLQIILTEMRLDEM